MLMMSVVMSETRFIGSFQGYYTAICSFFAFSLSREQGCCKVSLRPAGAGEKETGGLPASQAGSPQAPAKGRCPFQPRLFPILQQPWREPCRKQGRSRAPDLCC